MAEVFIIHPSYFILLPEEGVEGHGRQASRGEAATRAKFQGLEITRHPFSRHWKPGATASQRRLCDAVFTLRPSRFPDRPIPSSLDFPDGVWEIRTGSI